MLELVRMMVDDQGQALREPGLSATSLTSSDVRADAGGWTIAVLDDPCGNRIQPSEAP